MSASQPPRERVNETAGIPVVSDSLRAPGPFRELVNDLSEAAAAFATDAITARCRGAEVGMDPDAAEELAKLLTLAGAALTLLLGEHGSAA